MPPPDFDAMARRNAETLIALAEYEDLCTPLTVEDSKTWVSVDLPTFPGAGELVGDLTSDAIIPEDATGSGYFVARTRGVIAGLPVLELMVERVGLTGQFASLVRDGDRINVGDRIARISGGLHELLMLERTALNFLQRLSGIATLTGRFVTAVEGTKAVILDTRKTTPGWRALEKYAVRCGGGQNHRFGLYDMVLIKDNHLASLEHLGEAHPIAVAIQSARKHAPAGTLVEVEVDTLDQFDRALECRPDIVLVDNLGPDALTEAVRRRDARTPGVLLEASGGINLETVSAIARTGIDRISVGALTHSAPALDIGLDFDRSGLS